MAVGDRCMIALNGQVTTLAVDGLRLGRIVAESLPNCDVVWDDGVRQDGIVRNAVLNFVMEPDFDPTQPEPGQHVARFAQLVAYPALEDSDQPKSPAAAGVVEGALIVADSGWSEDQPIDPEELFGLLFMSWLDGRVKVIIPNAITGAGDPDAEVLVTDQPGRRLVGKG